MPIGAIAMPAALPIRDDRSPAALRRLARHERDGRVGARLVALANALEGLPREEAARLAGMTGQTLRDWVRRYNTEGLEGRTTISARAAHVRLTRDSRRRLRP